MTRRVRTASLQAAAVSVLATVLLVPTSMSLAAMPADTPGDDARVAAAVAALPGITADYMARTGVPGAAVAVVHKGQQVYAEGFGVRDVDTGEPVTPATVFQLASVSKSVGASVVAAAVGEGITSWDDPVRKHLPWFALSQGYATRNATVGDMYTMRSGLPGGAADILEEIGYSRVQILKRLRYLPFAAPFRTQYAYTNYGLTAGAEAVAEAAGMPWERLSQRLLYGPLGMTSTSSRYADFTRETNRAALHVKVDGRYQSRYQRVADEQSPAGGVSSNVLDLSRWMVMEINGGSYDGRQIVDAEALAAAQSPYSRSSKAAGPSVQPRFYGYGMGISVGTRQDVRLTHSGAFSAGAGTTYLMIPEYGVGIVVLANAFVGLPEAVAAAFADIVESGAVTRDWIAEITPQFAGYYTPNPEFTPDRKPADPAPSRAPSKYVGPYRNDFYGKVRVVRRHGALRLVMGPDRVVVPLRHWDGDEFVGTFGAGGDWPYEGAVTFGGGGSGRARTVDIGLGAAQVGLLRRV